MPKKSKEVRGFLKPYKPYKSYMFRDKDPVIDILRTAKEDSGMSVREISEKSGVSESAMHGWWNGNTRRPQFATANATARVMGREFVLRKIKVD